MPSRSTCLGRKADAVTVLQRQLQSLPPEEKQTLDDMRLLLGLIAGPESRVGRNALFGLLDRAVSRESQRAALQLLARGSDNGPTRAEFRAKLDQLIAAPTPHPIKEDLMVFRAQVALKEKNYGGAEEDARTLLESFPGSQLKAQALGVLTGVAWELRRYRTAADRAARLRAELPPGDARAQLGVLVADAVFPGRGTTPTPPMRTDRPNASRRPPCRRACCISRGCCRRSSTRRTCSIPPSSTPRRSACGCGNAVG